MAMFLFIWPKEFTECNKDLNNYGKLSSHLYGKPILSPMNLLHRFDNVGL